MAKKGKSTKKGKKSKTRAKADAEASAKADKGSTRGKGKGAKGKKGKGDARSTTVGGDAAAETPQLPQQPTAGENAATGATPAEAVRPVDQVAVLKLALRDTEAKLVAAEHRLRQVQQQLDDERRALAEAFAPSAEDEEAVVDAAVAETVAEVVVAAELAAVVAGSDTPDVDAAEVAAATLEDAADAIDAALADSGEPLGNGSGQGAQRSDLTPPLPEQGPDDEPNESWTLVHLRKEADRRGITGVSNLTKAALVERLRA